MFKVYFFVEGEPFKYRGAEAAAQAGRCYPEIIGYAQSTPLAEQVPGRPPSNISGIIELWFNSPDAALSALQQPLTLTDANVLASLVGHERVVMRLPDHLVEPYIKGVYPFRRKPGMSVADFQHHWWHQHGPIAALTEEALYYLQVPVLTSCYDSDPPVYDGITELHFRHRDAAIRAAASRQMREDQGGDAINFVDLESVELILVEEDLIISP